jgi:putative transposase
MGSAVPEYLGDMPRTARKVEVGGRYHVTAKGNRGEAIFSDDHDRRRFLGILADSATRHRWRCGAYCLMSNHFHVLVETPAAEQDLAAGMHRLNGLYAQWFNSRHDLRGHLFQDRFHSVLVEGEGHLLEVVRYIFLNPVRANACKTPRAWIWSSYSATVGEAPEPRFLAVEMVLELFGSDRDRGRARLASFVTEA